MYRDLIGCKFKTHGRTKEEGFDCYGLAIEVLRRNNIELIDVFYSDLSESEIVAQELFNKLHYQKLEKPEKLCIIMFKVKGRPTHVGIYLGDGQFIHATESGVMVDYLYKWKIRVLGYYKVSTL